VVHIAAKLLLFHCKSYILPLLVVIHLKLSVIHASCVIVTSYIV
jgi:hypothetical protein